MKGLSISYPQIFKKIKMRSVASGMRIRYPFGISCIHEIQTYKNRPVLQTSKNPYNLIFLIINCVYTIYSINSTILLLTSFLEKEGEKC